MELLIYNDATDSKPDSSKIEDSNMALKSLSKKNVDVSRNRIGWGLHASDDNTTFPPSRYRHDIMRQCYPRHDLSSDSNVYYNTNVRQHITTCRMNTQDWKCHTSRFNYGEDCRGAFPEQCGDNTNFEEDKDEDGNFILWRFLLKDDLAVHHFIVNPKHQIGPQYLNIYSRYITRTLNCNSNVQIGSPRSMFYVVHY